MEIGLTLLTNLMRRVGNNPFASAKTKATNLTRLLREEGYLIVYQDDMSRAREPETPAFNPLHASLEAPEHEASPVTRKEQARIYYERENWEDLYELKRTAKVYWDRLGFKAFEIEVIHANNPK